MPLYIRDDEIAALAHALQIATGARSKSEAVKKALQHELERAKKTKTVSERLAAARALIRSIGPRDPSFDLKAFRNEMWDDL